MAKIRRDQEADLREEERTKKFLEKRNERNRKRRLLALQKEEESIAGGKRNSRKRSKEEQRRANKRLDNFLEDDLRGKYPLIDALRCIESKCPRAVLETALERIEEVENELSKEDLKYFRKFKERFERSLEGSINQP